MELTTINNGQGKFFRGLVIGRVAEGETEYMIAVTEHGGIWYRGDWAHDQWHFLSEKAFTERFPKLAEDTLNKSDNLKRIKRELDSVSLLSF